MPSLAEFIAAVPASKRSVKFYIFAAMYSLGATSQAVSANQIDAALRALLPKNKRPASTGKSLSQYVGSVEAHDTSPATWSLTTVGIGELATMSGLPIGDSAESTKYGCDVGVICALYSPEMTAFRKACGAGCEWKEVSAPGLTHIYESCKIRTERGASLHVICSTQTTMGLTSAAILTTQLVMRFKPRLVMMVGIAAGTRSGGKQFGDVLVADPIIDYNSGKLVDDDGEQRLQPDPNPVGIAKRIRAILLRYKDDTEIFEDFRRSWPGSKPAMPNRLHVGPVGSADQVVDDPKKIEEIQLSWRKLIGLEMETYGVYRACEESPKPSPRHVAFKAVCDFAEKKTDDWQGFAAYMAASFSVYFLRSHWEEAVDLTGGNE